MVANGFGVLEGSANGCLFRPLHAERKMQVVRDQKNTEVLFIITKEPANWGFGGIRLIDYGRQPPHIPI
jgi:hypothetical protein